MKKVVFGLLVLTLSAVPGWAAGLKLAIGDGKVSIDAQDVTVRQILTEWARLGKTRIVNLEGVASGPLTLKLDNVPESVALDIILRAVPGYMAAPRATYVANASLYDRILIMATTTAAAVTRPPAGPGSATPNGYPGSSPNMTQLRGPGSLMPGMLPEPSNPADDDQQDDPAIAAAAAAGLVTVPAPLPGAMMLNPGMRAPLVDPTTPPAPAASAPSNPWNVSGGASRPGLAPPTPPPATTPATGIRRPPQADR
jgi:hypothetical protein